MHADSTVDPFWTASGQPGHYTARAPLPSLPGDNELAIVLCPDDESASWKRLYAITTGAIHRRLVTLPTVAYHYVPANPLIL